MDQHFSAKAYVEFNPSVSLLCLLRQPASQRSLRRLIRRCISQTVQTSADPARERAGFYQKKCVCIPPVEQAPHTSMRAREDTNTHILHAPFCSRDAKTCLLDCKDAASSWSHLRFTCILYFVHLSMNLCISVSSMYLLCIYPSIYIFAPTHYHYHNLVLLRPADFRSRFEHRLFTVPVLRTRVCVGVCACVCVCVRARARVCVCLGGMT